MSAQWGFPNNHTTSALWALTNKHHLEVQMETTSHDSNFCGIWLTPLSYGSREYPRHIPQEKISTFLWLSLNIEL